MLNHTSVIGSEPRARRAQAVLGGARWRGELFSLGGVLAPFATTKLTLAPWAFSAALLMTLAFWDPMARGTEPDGVLMGLAFYELLIGLTRERAPAA